MLVSTSQLESHLHVILLPLSPSHSPPSGSSELVYSVPDVGCFLSNFIKIILTLPSEPFLNCFISETKNPQEGTLISSVPPEDHEGTPLPKLQHVQIQVPHIRKSTQYLSWRE